jgi:arabinogalactan oligomer/maltooligosaccharide transport system permease protein
MSTETFAKPSDQRNPLRWFFFRARGDSPFVLLIINLVLIVACIAAIYPILRVFSIGLRPNNQLLSSSLAIIPAYANWGNYIQLFTTQNFWLWVWNSLVVTLSVSLIGVAMAATSAYAFSRWKFKGRSAGLLFLLATQMIPAGVLLIPIYLMLAWSGTKLRVQMINTYRGLILAYSTTALPFSIWILKGYYDTVSIDLEQAAMIDGASRLGAFWRIILLLSTPALAIVFSFNFMSVWPDFVVAYRIMLEDTLWTSPLGINSIQGQFQTQWRMYAAASILIMVTVLALFLYSSNVSYNPYTLTLQPYEYLWLKLSCADAK